MCGIIGYSKNNANFEDVELIEKLFLETAIRGKHATGISWISCGKIITKKFPVEAKTFLRDYVQIKDIIDIDTGDIRMIGHIRYSTSDLDWNQPFSNDKYSIVHNGVLSQEDPEEWTIKCEGRNDSEMILHALTLNEHPLGYFEDGSMAVCWMNSDGDIGGFRNGERPIWMANHIGASIFVSTEDIAYRSGIEFSQKLEMNVETVFHNDMTVSVNEFPTNKKDLQI